MRRAILCAAVLGLAIGAAAAPAQAQDQPLRSIEYRCVKQIGERAGLWPAWAKCAAQKLWRWDTKVQAVYADCWHPIWAERLREKTCNQCGNPTEKTLRCMQRRLGR